MNITTWRSDRSLRHENGFASPRWNSSFTRGDPLGRGLDLNPIRYSTMAWKTVFLQQEASDSQLWPWRKEGLWRERRERRGGCEEGKDRYRRTTASTSRVVSNLPRYNPSLISDFIKTLYFTMSQWKIRSMAKLNSKVEPGDVLMLLDDRIFHLINRDNGVSPRELFRQIALAKSNLIRILRRTAKEDQLHGCKDLLIETMCLYSNKGSQNTVPMNCFAASSRQRPSDTPRLSI